MKLILLKPQTLEWLANRDATSPENTWIKLLDGDTDDTETPLPPVPSLEGINEDLIWIWRCRETANMKWREIAELLNLKTPAAAWKRYHKLMKKEKEKVKH